MSVSSAFDRVKTADDLASAMRVVPDDARPPGFQDTLSLGHRKCGEH